MSHQTTGFSFTDYVQSLAPLPAPKPQVIRKPKVRDPRPLGFAHKYDPIPDLHGRFKNMSKRPLWYRPLNGSNRETRLGQEICDFLDFVRLTSTERHVRKELVADIEQSLNFNFDHSKKIVCSVFGSSATDLCFAHSDLDLHLINQDSDQTTLTRGNMASKLSKLARKVRSRASQLKIIKRARVPIIKMKHIRTNLEIDICYRGQEVQESVSTVLQLRTRQPHLESLVKVLKIFLENRDLNSVSLGGLGGYGLTLMVSRFLDLHPEVYRYRYQGSRKLKHDALLGSLLIDFFHFFGIIFDYHQLGFGYDGQLFVKAELGLPADFHLSLLDPNDPKNDVTQGTTRIQNVSSSFRDAYEVIQGIGGENGSILNRILTLPPAFIAARRRFTKLDRVCK